MKFTLKDYQEQAVDDVLANLKRARENFKHRREISSFSLTATTGAGKTVMRPPPSKHCFGATMRSISIRTQVRSCSGSRTIRA